ncbi:DNA topoisomerase [Xanthomonas sp. 1678]|uniref:DNA topoisomerase n=1 Tax=Xanthomonas sp. 1678 TaxID=3158788 RepID=UPI00286744F1|nr:DNA topoisomerase IA [Xanthomonas translucens]
MAISVLVDDANLSSLGKLLVEVGNSLQKRGRPSVSTSDEPAKGDATLPFNATALQAIISNRHGIGVPEVQKVTKGLYEKGFITYPLSKCSYLPVSQHSDASEILWAIARAMPDLIGLTSQADPRIHCRAFDDGKVGPHHAIVPTRSAPNMSQLNNIEQDVYRTVCLQYIAQFYPD